MIDNFRGEYTFLSNFFICPITYEGLNFPSVENAFQASKTLNLSERVYFTRISAVEAKREGRKLSLRPDWEEVKIKILTDLIKLKFQIPDLRQRLLSTNNEELVEGNTWNDTFWGVCNGIGQNNLGKILMMIREEIK